MNQSEIQKYDYIDALRGIAILGVILIHSSQFVTPPSAALQSVMFSGARGVQLFYVASALTLCMSWAARNRREKAPLRSFYIRRFFRIVPMFYLAIIVYVLIDGLTPRYWAPNGVKWWYIPLVVTFMNGFHPETITSIVPGGWSVVVEMSFYAILPFLISQMASLKSWMILFVISLGLYGLEVHLVPMVFCYPPTQLYLIKHFTFLNFFGQLPVFLLGILCYLILQRKFPRKQIALVGVGIFGVLACLLSVSKMPNHIIAGGLFVVFAVFLANWPVRLIVNRVFITVGKLSYSMYLSHFAVLLLLQSSGFTTWMPKTNLASLLFAACVAVLTSGLSYLSYRAIEKPGIAFGKKIIEELEDRAEKQFL